MRRLLDKLGLGGISVDASGYLFAAPIMVFQIIFEVFAIGFLIFFSFFKWDLISAPQFVGFQNFIKFIHSAKYWAVLYHTFLYVAGIMSVSILVGLLLALLFSEFNVKGRRLFLIAIFLPYVTSQAATGYIWQWMFAQQGGLVNYYLGKLGLPTPHWTTTPGWAMFAVILMSCWRLIGYNTLLFFIGIQAIPEVHYEAAKMDGASKMKSFWHITLPLLTPTFLFVLIITMVASTQAFTPVYVLTGGGPYGSTEVLMMRIYNMAFNNYQFGYANAISLSLVLMLMGVMIVGFKYFSQKT